jgi:nucleotide-binding universal stress UspA family protein
MAGVQDGTAGRIVVGADGSEGGQAALRWALGEAELRGATVDAVLSLRVMPMMASPAVALVPDREEEVELGRQLLGQTVADAASMHPTVRVNQVVMEGGAARALLEVAHGADLLVVGSRGRGGFTGLLLGSVSQQCVHHATCPVVVVRG